MRLLFFVWGCLVIFLFGAFWAWDVNPGNWPHVGRLFVIAMWFLWAVVMCLSTEVEPE